MKPININTKTTLSEPNIISKQHSRSKVLKLPEFIGIGARKCGTGAFRDFFCQHPEISCSRKAELHFWLDARFGMKKVKNYKSEFLPFDSGQKLFEKSPSYLHHVGAPRHIKTVYAAENSTYPTFILIVCDPVKRSYSDFIQRREEELKWRHNKVKLQDFRSSIKTGLEDVKKTLPNYNFSDINSILKFKDDFTSKTYSKTNRLSYLPDIITTGLYNLHLKDWMQYFSKRNFIVIDGTKFLTNPSEILDQVQTNLNLSNYFTQEKFLEDVETGLYCLKSKENEKTGKCLKKLNKGRSNSNSGKEKRKKQLTPEISSMLQDFYKPFNDDLKDLFNLSFTW